MKVIAAVIQARPDLLSETWVVCGPQLVRRFKEREENVRLDILACFASIVQASYGGKAAASGASTNAPAGELFVVLVPLRDILPANLSIYCCVDFILH